MAICTASSVPKTQYAGLANGTPGHGRPLSGPQAHPYLWMLEQVLAGTLRLEEFGTDELGRKDRAVVEYALRAQAAQATQHKRSGRLGGQNGVGAVKSRPQGRHVALKPWVKGVDPRTGKRNGVRHPK